MSAFRKWFVEQHGARPSSDPWMKLKQNVINAEVELAKARDVLAACEKWDERETSALWAWQACEKQK